MQGLLQQHGHGVILLSPQPLLRSCGQCSCPFPLQKTTELFSASTPANHKGKTVLSSRTSRIQCRLQDLLLLGQCLLILDILQREMVMWQCSQSKGFVKGQEMGLAAQETTAPLPQLQVLIEGWAAPHQHCPRALPGVWAGGGRAAGEQTLEDLQVMEVLALTLVTLLALLPPAQPCSSEMNKVKDLLEVNCTGQALSAVPPDLPADTGILLLSDNRLESLSTTAFLSLTQLQDIDLANNGLVALHTGPLLLSLKELTLSHNALAALPVLEGLPALTHLAVAHNSLETLAPGAFRTVPELQNLDLRGNKMQQLPQEAFAGLKALKELDLSDNLLKELPKELLQDLKKLETLWLSGNQLQTLPTDFFPKGHFFMYVFLTENPWHCNCDLHYLQTWIQKNADIVYQPERGLEETKVEVAPEKVLCHSPAEHRQKPIIHFKLNCSIVEDADEEGGDEYNYEEETREKATMTTFPPHPFIPKEHTTMPCAITSSCLPTLTTTRSPLTRPSLSTPCTSTLSPNPLLVVLTSIRAPGTTIPVPASLTMTPTQTPSTATILTAATTITLHRPATFDNAPSLPTAMSNSPSSTSGHPQTTLAANSIYGSLVGSTGTFPTTSTAVPSTAMLEASSIVTSPCPTLMSANTMLSTHAPTLPPPLDTTHFTQPACSPLPAPPPLCPCSIPGQAVPVLRLQAGGEALQWGQWVLRHCCLLHWVLYLASLALLVLTMLALAGWLTWMCLVGQPSWHQSLQTQEVQYPLLEWRESTGNPMMHLSSFKIPLQQPKFCTIKEVELCPEVTYCTIKDLGIQRSCPASYSFCTTKELWVHQSSACISQAFLQEADGHRP